MACLTVMEVSKTLRTKDKHIYYLAYMGKIEGWKVRGTWRFSIDSVKEYERALRKNRRNTKAATSNFDNTGDLGLFTMRPDDNTQRNMGRELGSIQSRRMLEHNKRRLYELPVKTFQPVKAVQLELFSGLTA